MQVPPGVEPQLWSQFGLCQSLPAMWACMYSIRTKLAKGPINSSLPVVLLKYFFLLTVRFHLPPMHPMLVSFMIPELHFSRGLYVPLNFCCHQVSIFSKHMSLRKHDSDVSHCIWPPISHYLVEKVVIFSYLSSRHKQWWRIMLNTTHALICFPHHFISNDLNISILLWFLVLMALTLKN